MTERRNILVFGGTAEGRLIVEWLDGRNSCDIVACTATEYGASLLLDGRNVTTLQGPLSSQDKQQLMSEHAFACIVDATHPYALHISESIEELARQHGTNVLRIVRDQYPEGSWTSVVSVQEAARYVAGRKGNVLTTTGSKNLAVFIQALPDFADRLYARILPVPESIGIARNLGIPTDHIIAMQGPFSVQMNRALIREFGIACMVSKQSGSTGGFGEKVQAAQECGIELVVVAPPEQRDGMQLEDAKKELEGRYGL